MKIILSQGNIYVLRFDGGDEVMGGLAAFCKERGINASQFSVIGVVKEVVLAFYNLQTKSYEDHEIREDVEVSPVQGNIAVMDGELVVHAHGSFANRNLEVKAGHVKKLIVSTVCEVVLTAFDGEMKRGYDDATGLNILQ